MKRLIKYIALLSSVLLVQLLPKQTAQACGFYVFGGEYRFWLLQPDLVNEPDLTPFYFASTYLYKRDVNAAEEPSIAQNVEEWYKVLAGAASKADIDAILNATQPNTFLDNTDSLQNINAFYRYLIQPQNKAYYDYMVLSKEVEQMANNPDPWGERGNPYNKAPDMIEPTMKLYDHTTNPFLKLRTAYQLQRLYHLCGQNKRVEKLYDSLIAPLNTTSWIKTAALYRTADNRPMAQTSYVYSKVFDRGNYHRTACLVSFNSEAYEATLALAKNQHERNVITAMKAFNYPGRTLEYLEAIYNTEKTYQEIPFLLLREINKLEDWLVTNKVTEFAPAVYNGEPGYYNAYNKAINYPKDVSYGKNVYAFTLRMANNVNIKNRALICVYAAHLAMLLNNNTAAKAHLEKAKSMRPLPANLKTQIKINSFLLHLQMSNGFTPHLADELMSILQKTDKELAIYDAGIMKDQLILYTARKAMAKGSMAKGLLLLAQTNRTWGEIPVGATKNVYQEMTDKAAPKDFDEMIALIDKKHKTPFEKMVVQNRLGTSASYSDYFKTSDFEMPSRDRILDSKATCFIKNDMLDSALYTVRLLSDSVWKKYPYNYYISGNPFFLNINTLHHTTPFEGMNCNKKEVLEEMVLLQKRIKTEPTKAAVLKYQMANAYFNMTYWGRNWMMMRQWWSANDYGDKRTAFNDIYFGCTRAKKYYLLAMQQTTDKKLAALCCFMVGKCDENYKQYLWDCKQTDRNYTAAPTYRNKYIKQLNNDSYYTEMVHECEVYSSYVSQYSNMP